MMLNLLNANRELVEIIDTAKEVVWTKKFRGVGGCAIKIAPTTYLLNLLTTTVKYISRDDDDMICTIEQLSIVQNTDTGEDELTITCLSINNLLTRRLIWEQINLTPYYSEIAMRFLVSRAFIDTIAARQVDFIKLGTIKGYQDETTDSRQYMYENTLDAVIGLSEAYNNGFRFLMNANKEFVFDVYKGVDHSVNQSVNDYVIFSPDYLNLKSLTYDIDYSMLKNVTKVGGEGEGTARKTYVVGGIAGIERRELFTDAKSTSTTSDAPITQAEYNQFLINSGRVDLAAHSITKKYAAEIDISSYKYKTDFDLGDYVTIQGKYGVSVDAQIIEVIEQWVGNEYSIVANIEI